MLWEYKNIDRPKSIEGIGWKHLWTVKLHVESGSVSLSVYTPLHVLISVFPTIHVFQHHEVMAMTLSQDHSLALSVSADPLISRYQISVSPFKNSLLALIDSETSHLPHHHVPQSPENGFLPPNSMDDPTQTSTPSNANINATSHRTKHPGNGSVAIRGDARVCAVGGWDGKSVFVLVAFVPSMSHRTLTHDPFSRFTSSLAFFLVHY